LFYLRTKIIVPPSMQKGLKRQARVAVLKSWQNKNQMHAQAVLASHFIGTHAATRGTI
jgi:hypothetical protein